jgi:hypothetical protein
VGIAICLSTSNADTALQWKTLTIGARIGRAQDRDHVKASAVAGRPMPWPSPMR